MQEFSLKAWYLHQSSKYWGEVNSIFCIDTGTFSPHVSLSVVVWVHLVRNWAGLCIQWSCDYPQCTMCFKFLSWYLASTPSLVLSLCAVFQRGSLPLVLLWCWYSQHVHLLALCCANQVAVLGRYCVSGSQEGGFLRALCPGHNAGPPLAPVL